MPRFDETTNGWEEYKRWVLAEIRRLDQEIKRLDQQGRLESLDMARLQVKASLWGGLAGLIPVILYLVFRLLSQK